MPLALRDFGAPPSYEYESPQPKLKFSHAKAGGRTKKQALSCFFCRERKIACGRPDEGSTDQSCKLVAFYLRFSLSLCTDDVCVTASAHVARSSANTRRCRTAGSTRASRARRARRIWGTKRPRRDRREPVSPFLLRCVADVLISCVLSFPCLK
ncbi:hypothetical protein C8R43DRAFT_167290 [Mycena crocata]|nr:hypothetical protein C8R43DRAFT_167290 [Mycena crocata]